MSDDTPNPPQGPSADGIAEAVAVRPGDTLLLRVGYQITAEEADYLKGKVAERMPGVFVAILCGVDQMAVHRPESGRCGTEAPELTPPSGQIRRRFCILPAGHAGWHRADDGSEWTLTGGPTAEAALARVRDLHERHDSDPVPVCHECLDRDGCYEHWPCPTIRAIDPEEDP